MTLQKLVFTPSPNVDEGLYGYILRVSEGNGYKTPQLVIRCAGLKRFEDLGKFDTYGPLSQILGVKSLRKNGYDNFRSKGVLHREGKTGGMKKKMPANVVKKRKPSFCPQCLKEDQYLSKFWDLSIVVACPKHRCRLLDKCASCNKRISWMRRGLDICSCGGSLTSGEVDMVPAHVADFMGIIQFICFRKGSVKRNSSNFPLEHIKAISIPRLIELARVLYKFMNPQDPPKSANVHLQVENLAHVLSDWPHNYHRALHQMGSYFESNLKPSRHLRRQFSPLYESIFKTQRNNGYEFLKDEFINFGVSKWEKAIVTITPSDARGIDMSQRFVAVSTVSKLYNANSQLTNALCRKGIIDCQSKKINGHESYVVDLNSPNLEVILNGDVKNSRELANCSNVPINFINEMRGLGILENRYRPTDGTGIHELDFRKFRGQWLSRSESIDIDTRNRDDVVNLDFIYNGVRFWVHDSRAKFLAAYMSGDINSLGRVGAEFKSVYFSKNLVEGWIADSLASQGVKSYSVTEASKILGITHLGAVELARDGHIDSINSINGGVRVAVDSVENFNKQYFFLNNLAKELGTSVAFLRKLSLNLDSCVWQLSGKREYSSNRCYFMRRKDESHLIDSFEKVRSEKVEKKEILSFEDKRQKQTELYLIQLYRYAKQRSKAKPLLPKIGNKVNVSEIAREINIDRNLFYSCKPLRSYLNTLIDFDGSQQGWSKNDPIVALRGYLEHVKDRNENIPLLDNGEVNKSELTRSLGINRSVFYRSTEALKIIEELRCISVKLCLTH